MVFQTATNAAAQKMQAVIKQAAAKAGIEMELKSVVAVRPSTPRTPPIPTPTLTSTPISSSPPTCMGPPDPERLMRVFTSWEVANKANNWQRFNVWRWRNDEYDRLFRSAETEMDPVKRAALFIRMNDLVVQSGIVVPDRPARQGRRHVERALRGIEHNVYEVDFWNLPFWYREG